MMNPKQRLSRNCLLLALVALTSSWTPMRAQTTDEQEQQLIPATVSEQAQAFYARARTGTVPASDAADPERLERIRNMLGRMFRGFAEDISTDFELVAQDLGGVPGFWVKTPQTRRTDKVIVYLHGGGYILGSAETNLGSALRIGSAAGIPVLSVEYRLAPEHPFPAALDDAATAYGWLLDNGYRGGDIAVYGDSAGGGLALALTLHLRDQGTPLPASVAVLSPLTDIAGRGDTRATLAEFDPVLRSAGGGRYALYAGGEPLNHPLISPVYADYHGFPPLLIQVGTREKLLSDSVRLARRARRDGANVTLDVWEGMWHGWHDHPDLPEADLATGEVAQFFLTYFDSAGQRTTRAAD